ncbi:MAG: GGDEF domain-containing protein [Angustibacter sp.]
MTATALETDDSLGGVVLRSLRPVALTLASLYGLYTVAFLLSADGPHDLANAADCLVSSTILAALAWGAPRWRWSSRRPHATAALACSVVIYNTVGLLSQTGEARQTTNVMLVVVGVGVLMLSWPWALLLEAAALGGWLAVAVSSTTSGTNEEWVHFAFALLSATALSNLVLFVRRRQLLQLASAREELRELALVDPLTSLHNRRGLLHLGENAVSTADRAGRPVTVVFVDVDGMKQVNDRLGHAAGDLALQQTAQALRLSVRDCDVCARLGGDEFCVLMPDALPDVRLLADRLRATLDEVAGRPMFGVSVGAARRDPGSGVSLEELIERADAAMYVDKQDKDARLLAQS